MSVKKVLGYDMCPKIGNKDGNQWEGMSRLTFLEIKPRRGLHEISE